jgi:ABC-2 type transport system permease protein
VSHDILAMIWKELREWSRLPTSMMVGSRFDGLLGLLGPLALIGIGIPIAAKAAWVTSPLSLFIIGWLPLTMMLFAIADSFAGERERHTLETLLATRLSDEAILIGKIASLVVVAWGQAVALLILSLVTVNVVYGRERLLMFAGVDVAAFVVFTLLLSVLEACGGVLICLRAATVRQAARNLLVGFCVILFGGLWVTSPKFLPDEWRSALIDAVFRGSRLYTVALLALLVAALDVAVYAAAKARFRRARLIFD